MYVTIINFTACVFIDEKEFIALIGQFWEKCIEKHEAQPSASHTSRMFLKIPKYLYTCNSTMHEHRESFLFLLKMLKMSKKLL